MGSCFVSTGMDWECLRPGRSGSVKFKRDQVPGPQPALRLDHAGAQPVTRPDGRPAGGAGRTTAAAQRGGGPAARVQRHPEHCGNSMAIDTSAGLWSRARPRTSATGPQAADKCRMMMKKKNIVISRPGRRPATDRTICRHTERDSATPAPPYDSGPPGL